MFESLLIATGLLVFASAYYAFAQTRDALQPAVFTAPLFIYFYSIWPLLLSREGGLPDFFTAAELAYVAGLNLLSIAALYAGMLKWPKRFARPIRRGDVRQRDVFALNLPRATRKRLLSLGLILGMIALVAYWYAIFNVGGFESAYGRAKGGGWASSGYIGEAPLLAFPAIVLIALARQGLRIRAQDILLALLIASPHLLQGTFGGRRGPLFLILALLFLVWFIAKGVRPRFRTIVVGVTAISVAVVLVWSQRQHLYLGSGGEFEATRVVERIGPEEIDTGNEYLAGVATVLTADEIGNFYWGHRYFVTFFIRPIPKQLWPTKYEDVGADWLYRYGDEEREERYQQAVGFSLLAGSSTGYIADVYYEFAWGVVVVSYLLGRVFCALWERHRLRGGLWTILFLQLLILSIYLPTQSLTASLHRFLFMGGITYLVWRYWVRPTLRRRAAAAAYPQQP
ncbi:MAG: oligosaccharide repeat unit polymerase [Candidatus Competibacteraceae bacterium]